MHARIQSLSVRLDECLLRDRHRLCRRLRELARKLPEDETRAASLAQLSEDIERSCARRAQRAQHLPRPDFPDALPVVEQKDAIAAAIRDHQVVVICGETGSGKTTQLPKICLELGRGVAGMIGHTQPRRIAARSVAARIARELGCELGSAVGYQVRFTERVGENTYIKLMTDGILLAETQTDRFLERYDTLIIDEAHERSLNIDFLLGYLKRLLPRRPDLKLIITSATIDPERFARHFDDAPIVRVSGRTYPVEVRYRPLLAQDEDEQDRDQQQAILDAVDELARLGSGDVLVFLSGEREIRETAEALRKHHPPHTRILPLYARLSVEEQNRVFQPHAGRRIVLATNVAETSLTVPGIRYVVDPGYARISRYSYRTKVQRLPIEKISRASADQRKGRCGRVAAGVCIRLYAEDDFLQRPEFTEPEIRRTNLAAVILQMRALRLGDIEDFPFVDPPDSRYVSDGFKLLHELGAVDEARVLTDVGRHLARLPVDPRIGRMILAAQDGQCLAEVLVITAALSVQDPRERPHDLRQKADEAHRKFRDERSDFLAYLNLWNFYHEQARHLSRNKLRGLCREHFLSHLRMREWHDVHQQLLALVKDMGMRLNQEPADYDAVHRALLCGLLGNVAVKTDAHEYTGARNLKLSVFPGSALFRKGPQWLMAAELVETGRNYLHTAARIEPQWIEELAPHLVRRSHFEPHWEARAGQVAAYERVALYGLVINPKRKINFGPIDPVLARSIFIRSALVQGEYRTQAPFLEHNRKLIAGLEDIEHKSRRRDVLVDEETIYRFYDERVPAGIYSRAQFEQWRKRAERETPQLLFMTRDQLMQEGAQTVGEQDFPKTLRCNGMDLPLQYRFEPGHPEDGVTVTVPLAALNQLDETCLEWLVPGLLFEKIVALIKSLPKSLRRHFVPAPQFARACIDAIGAHGGRRESLHAALSAQLARMTGVTPPPEAWQPAQLPPHLRMNVRVIDERGAVTAMGRDLGELQARLAGAARRSFHALPELDREREGIRAWDFGELPERVEIARKGMRVPGFPALVERGDSVALCVLDTAARAQAATRAGLRRLFMLQLPQQVKYLRRNLPGLQAMCLRYAALADAPAQLQAAQGERVAPERAPCEELREALIERAFDEVFLAERAETRTEAEFNRRLQEGQGDLVTSANALCERVGKALDAHHDARVAVDTAAGLPAEVRAQLREQLAWMVHRGFVQHTPQAALAQLPRYLRAVTLRAQRYAQAPGRDRERAAEVEPLWRQYLTRLQQPPKSAEEGAALDHYRWMIEELRVSLFAQELKTAYPVSTKRVQRYWDEHLR